VEDRSIILVDMPEGSTFDAGFLEELGHGVVVCHGPTDRTLCPMLATGSCPTADAAHGIIFELDLDRPQHRAILAAYRQRLPDDVPIRVVTTQDKARQYASLLSAVQVWTHDPTTGDLDGFASLVEAADWFRDMEESA
jgi:hypothetical protein